ncbi:MAG: hypothetical protein GTO14_01910, partial [Anaerolineales bacterium]|nr:hypothetical protein [Anaerolineales bacterium]
MFKRVFSLTALIVMMFVAQACNFPSADRVTETVPPDAPSRTEAIEAPETEEPAPPAGPMDCGDDLGCFSDAA